MAKWLDRYGAVESGYQALMGQQHYLPEVMGAGNGLRCRLSHSKRLRRWESQTARGLRPQARAVRHLLFVTVTKQELPYGLE